MSGHTYYIYSPPKQHNDGIDIFIYGMSGFEYILKKF